ncbi:NAD(P)/FAD-dependent oxidoreductase [Aestuariicella hydrocarbonica]|uniref:NAD(P)/FAD-dependent oxidoreductase n=1 Tax=Pseudomaricurvus hydrocarbonicus TaxID=1470433 RepID=A0A9E5K0A6_9GAMM|nr:NAD(P)/FAD-dependent oxidoreductase [Aestuariicella hydrocarbonica]NHO66137.1 NAD(P)/FAD-dependent oxidoreductase [Aestuariicella hydrocarbonica]
MSGLNQYETTSDIMPTKKIDAVVIGAGLGGMYALQRLRGMNLSVIGIESGGDVGGVWYWNRYPGARCDLMSIDYCYSFSKEIEEEWSWTEQYAAQPEILAYLNFVADKLDLRKDFNFNTRVVSAKYNEARKTWIVTTDKGDFYEAKYCVMATGPLSVPKDPEFPGTEDFEGEIIFAGKWPHKKVNFEGKRVGVVGTGSTGIQIVPVVAEEAQELVVFQRTPSFTLPMRNMELDDEYLSEVRRNYEGLRDAARNSPLGGMRPRTTRPFFSLPRKQREDIMEDAWKRGGLSFLGAFSDLLTNPEANEQVAEFVRNKISQVVENPDTAERLKPQGYPIFARRACLDTNYYETFNKSHVRLADCLTDPIEGLTKNGVKTRNREYDLDVLICATGYDGLTGAMLAFDVEGKDGRKLKDKWENGARSYMGMVIEGFPNMFMICGANGPAALANIFTINEQNVDWFCDCISHMHRNNYSAFECTESAENEWMSNVASLAEKTLISKAKTWYVGANIDGKPKGLTLYTDGFQNYRAFCSKVAEDGYTGITFEKATVSASSTADSVL